MIAKRLVPITPSFAEPPDGVAPLYRAMPIMSLDLFAILGQLDCYTNVDSGTSTVY
jgi:hypothetical protein